MQLPGGVTFNGDKILSDAVAERKELEKVIYDSSLPIADMIG